MLRKLADTVSGGLLPLLAALLLTVGMPLLHPALHSHPAQHHSDADHFTAHEHEHDHDAARLDEIHGPNCLICDFLATSPWYDTKPCPVVSQNKAIGKIVLLDKVCWAATCPLQIEPRAPPVLASV